jgi:predicted ArsR family transcriptional regulator
VAVNLLELISEPVRLAIVRQLSSTGSAPLSELAERAGVHLNTVRSHMSELEAAGVVERGHAPSDGPGRPQVRYRLRAGWELPSSDMRGLGELLAALAVSLDPSAEKIEALGRHWGRFLSGRPGGDPVASLPRLLERLGFDAELDGSELRLRSCPCPLISPEHPELICRLAGAAIDGIAEADAGGRRVSSSEHDPVCRRCTLHLAAPPPSARREVVRAVPAAAPFAA